MLELFVKDWCPYCLYVQKFIESQGRDDIVFHNIRKDGESRDRLIEVGGKQQVPCLFIDGDPLYESEDIVAWLREH